MSARQVARVLVPAATRPALARLLPPGFAIAEALIENTARADPALAELYPAMSDEQARMHFGEDNILESRQLRAGVRLFHAWKLKTLRERLGPRLAELELLDVGDSDGLLLKHLGKDGTGFNLSPRAILNIEANGVRAVQGDGHGLPFDDGSFDVVLCFQTLEHVENQHAVLEELARVCRPGGRCFLSVPWVPQTFVHARNPAVPRGEDHIFELSRDHLAALITHTPFRLVFEDVCELFAAPRGLAQRAFLWRNRRNHVVSGTFRAFQLFELELPLDAAVD